MADRRRDYVVETCYAEGRCERFPELAQAGVSVILDSTPLSSLRRQAGPRSPRSEGPRPDNPSSIFARAYEVLE